MPLVMPATVSGERMELGESGYIIIPNIPRAMSGGLDCRIQIITLV